MATRSFCDRCSRANCQLVPVLGVDLCNTCIGDFGDWVAMGPAKTRKTSIRRGEWPAVIAAAIAELGVVTPALLAERTNTTRARAHWQLNYQTRLGHIRSLGRARFAALRSEQEAAE